MFILEKLEDMPLSIALTSFCVSTGTPESIIKRDSLFENFSRTTVNVIEDQIRDTVRNYEPRVNNIGIEVTSFPDDNNFEIKVLFDIKGLDVPTQAFSFLLEPTR